MDVPSKFQPKHPSEDFYDVLNKLILSDDVSLVDQFLKRYGQPKKSISSYVGIETANDTSATLQYDKPLRFRDKNPIYPTNIPERPFTARNPISLAAEEGRADIFDVLVRYGFSAKSRDIGGPGYRHSKFQPLHLAVREGHVEMVKRLVEKYGADVNKVVRGTTPLHLAVIDRRTEVLEYLLQHGANPMHMREPSSGIHMVVYEVAYPLIMAVRLQYWDIVRTIILRYIIEDIDKMLILLNALLKQERRDLAYLSYEHCAESLKVYPFHKVFLWCVKTLHFLLEVRYPALFEDFKPCTIQLGENCSYDMMLEAGCPAIHTQEYFKSIDQNHESANIRERIQKFLYCPFSLKDLSAFRIRKCLGKVLPETVDKLPLPSYIKRYIRLEHLLYHTLK